MMAIYFNSLLEIKETLDKIPNLPKRLIQDTIRKGYHIQDDF